MKKPKPISNAHHVKARAEELAERLAVTLFTSGGGKRAHRLVLEMKPGCPLGGPGLCIESARDFMAKEIVQAVIDGTAVHPKKRIK